MQAAPATISLGMDQEVQITQEDIQKLSPNDQTALQSFIQAENQKGNIQRTIHEFTETCFKKCIGIRGASAFSSGRLTGKEDGCMKNCVERFMDSNLAVLKHLETMRAQQ